MAETAFVPQSALLSVMITRGYLYQATDLEALDACAVAGPITGYIGFDCTAPSLHVGSLVQMMMLRRMQQHGHKPIVLIGGGTTKIGDPSDKDKARPVLTEETIQANAAGIKRVFSRLLTFGDGPADAVMVDNDEWLSGLSYLGFLRDYGRHFTINKMVALESVKRRLEREQPLTFLEFNYMLLQAYDFLELNRRYGCTLQLGGSDQWGNITNGTELIRRMDGKEAFGITTPLLTTASGAKMGKTADGAIWLSGDMLAPYDFWQYWRNTEDADVGRFLRLFTDISLEEIARLEALEGAEINDAKIVLADAVTTLIHGDAATIAAKATAAATFSGGVGDDLPTLTLRASEIAEGIALLDLFRRSGLVESGGEAKRHAKAGALKVNDAVIDDLADKITLDNFADAEVLKLSVGKKKHARIIRAD
jgi:tyrosyl-tRNA synthetase